MSDYILYAIAGINLAILWVAIGTRVKVDFLIWVLFKSGDTQKSEKKNQLH